jgi:hypothetical protein
MAGEGKGEGEGKGLKPFRRWSWGDDIDRGPSGDGLNVGEGGRLRVSEMGRPMDRMRLGPSGAHRSTCSDNRVLLASRDSGARGEVGAMSSEEFDDSEEESDVVRDRLRRIEADPSSGDSRVKWGTCDGGSRPAVRPDGAKRGAALAAALIEVD